MLYRWKKACWYRLLAVWTALFCFICCILPTANAEASSIQTICITDSVEERWYQVLIEGDEVYLSAPDYQILTGYEYNENETLVAYTLGNKTIMISKENGMVQLPSLGIYENAGIQMKGIRNYLGQTYLSMAELLPWLNVTVSIENGKLCVIPDDLSIWEVVAELDSDKYLFNFCKDYGDSISSCLGHAAMITFDLFINMRLDMIWTGQLAYTQEQYKEAYLDLSVNDALASEKLESVTDGILTINKNIDTIEDALGIDEKNLDETISSLLFSSASVETLMQYASFATYWRDIRALINVSSAMDHWAQPLKVLKISEIYLKDVSDYTIYLQRLCRDGKRTGAQLRGLRQAERIFRGKGWMIADELFSVLGTYLGDVVDQGLDKIISNSIVGGLKSCIDLAGIFYSTVFNFKQTFSGMTELGMYASMATQSWNEGAAYQMKLATQENLLMMCESYKMALKASKKCFENMANVMDIRFLGIPIVANADHLMDYRINPIDEMLIKLSATAVNRENDSVENKQEYQEEIRDMLKNILPLRIPSTDAEIPSGQVTQAADLKTYFYENFSSDDRVVVADVTHDGIDDMIVVTMDDEPYERSYTCYVCIVSQNGEIKTVEHSTGSNFHAGGFFNVYIRQTEEGFWNMGHESNDMWQGYGSLRFDEYYLDASGNIVLVNSIAASSPSDEIPISDEEYNWYESAVKQAKEQRAFYTIVETETLEPTCPIMETNPEVIFLEN